MNKTTVNRNDLTRLAQLHQILEVQSLLSDTADKIEESLDHLNLELPGMGDDWKETVANVMAERNEIQARFDALQADMKGASEEVNRLRDVLSKSYDRNAQLVKDLITLKETINTFVQSLGSKALNPLEMKQVNQGQPIEAIKSLRLASGCDLRTAKSCIDAYKAERMETPPQDTRPIMPVMCKIGCDGSQHPAARCRS